jgi:hypothetical protein
MTYLIRPDDLGEVQVRRFSDELHLYVSSETHSWVLVVPNGDNWPTLQKPSCITISISMPSH